MKRQLLQIRLSNQLKNRLEEIAKKYELSLSTLARFILAEFSRREPSFQLTPSGFSLKEEERILRSFKQTKEEIRANKAEVYDSVEKALTALENT